MSRPDFKIHFSPPLHNYYSCSPSSCFKASLSFFSALPFIFISASRIKFKSGLQIIIIKLEIPYLLDLAPLPTSTFPPSLLLNNLTPSWPKLGKFEFYFFNCCP